MERRQSHAVENTKRLLWPRSRTPRGDVRGEAKLVHERFSSFCLSDISSERDFGFGDSDELLTNQEIIDLLFPTNPKLPYVYDKFDSWGSCTDWDFDVAVV